MRPPPAIRPGAETIPPRATAGALAGIVVMALLAIQACNEPPAVNPWRDDAIPRDAWTTPSEQGVLAAERPPVIRRRPGEPIHVPQASDATPHYPLWFEDPFEDKGDGDGRNAWTWADYLAVPYGLSRFGLNFVAAPLSMIVTPPGTPMVSDGQLSPGGLGLDHDAARGRSPNPTATPADFTATQPAEDTPANGDLSAGGAAAPPAFELRQAACPSG